jgi:ribose-phosphate pyrophosphokinase
VTGTTCKIFSGSANRALAEEICQYLSLPVGDSTAGRFSDGEIYFQINENVRGADVFVVQPTCHPGDTNLMELLLMVDAFKRASAARITAVIPYYGYARQDRKDKPRVPISAKVVADLLETAGINRALTLDLHAPQIQGYFNVPVDHLYATPVFLEYFARKGLADLTIVSPDAGGVERARFFAKKLDAPLAIVDKRRVDINVAEILHIIGEVEGRTAIIIDDIVDTAGTLTNTVEALLGQGAKEVYAACTHAVLSGPAVRRICDSKLREMVVTNSIPLREEARDCGPVRVLSVAPLLARAIRSIHEEASVSTLFV